jgi:hypothetical protein
LRRVKASNGTDSQSFGLSPTENELSNSHFMLEIKDMDWLLQLLLHPINLFEKIAVFDEAVDRFKRHGYISHEFDCRKFHSQEDILNAILHALGGVTPDYIYKNIQPIQFWDLLHIPEFGQERGALLAFSHFDTFYRLDPECGQELLDILAGRHYSELKRGNRLIICAHCEDRTLKLQPVLTIEAKWTSIDGFSTDKDISRERFTKSMEWCTEVGKQVEAEIGLQLRSIGVAMALNRMTETEDITRFPDTNLTIEEAVKLIKDYEAQKVAGLRDSRGRKIKDDLEGKSILD